MVNIPSSQGKEFNFFVNITKLIMKKKLKIWWTEMWYAAKTQISNDLCRNNKRKRNERLLNISFISGRSNGII